MIKVDNTFSWLSKGGTPAMRVENTSQMNLWKGLLKFGDPQEFNFGDVIYKQYEPSKGIYYFLQGKIKLFTNLDDGMERTIRIVVTPHILGETSLIDDGVNLCTAIALAKTKILFIPRERVQTNLLSNAILINMIMSSLANKIRYMQFQVENAAFTLPQRIARLLLNFNDEINFHNPKNCSRLIVTHDELASILGTTRPKITKHLNDFYNLGLLEKGRGFIRIIDCEGLKSICGKFNGKV